MGDIVLIFQIYKGCCTQGNNLEEAISHAEDSTLWWLLTEVEEEI